VLPPTLVGRCRLISTVVSTILLVLDRLRQARRFGLAGISRPPGNPPGKGMKRGVAERVQVTDPVTGWPALAPGREPGLRVEHRRIFPARSATVKRGPPCASSAFSHAGYSWGHTHPPSGGATGGSVVAAG